VKLLPDTHLLLWAFDNPGRLSKAAVALIDDAENELFFSAIAIWEIAIKSALQKKNFRVDPRAVRRGLLSNGYIELPVTSEHAAMVSSLPLIHKDPFDRILIAQATVEGITLLTSDRQVAKYPGPIRKV
jgi:PIN domain nuclease of toxin-antitoxin system